MDKMELPPSVSQDNEGRIAAAGSLGNDRAVDAEGDEAVSRQGDEAEAVNMDPDTKRVSRFTKQSSLVQALPSDIDVELLRGVPVTEVLNGFGKHWKSIKAKPTDYSLSQPRNDLDDFLSHNWQTSRALKVLALCYLYNRRLAFLASCSIAPLLAWLGAGADAGSFVRGKLATLVCPFVYVTVFLFGQRLRGLVSRPRYVFLDKLCIHQTDEQKKAAGILGLAGFLRASKRLVILWSPRYFSRLWCTYELVTWCYLHGLDPDKIAFLSVAACNVHAQATASWILVYWLKFTVRYLKIDGLIVPNLAAALLNLPFSYIAVGFIYEWVSLEAQIQAFRVRDSSCFCCTHGHVDPVSGQPMQCDRKLVYRTLSKWCKKATQEGDDMADNVAAKRQIPSGVEDALDEFDKVVRHGLSRTWYGAHNRILLCFSYADCAACCVGSVWAGLDDGFFHWRDGRRFFAARWFVEWTTLPLFVWPLAFAVGVNFVSWRAQAGGHVEVSWMHRVMHAALAATVYLSSFILLWLPGPLLVSNEESLGVLDVLLMTRFFGLALLSWYMLHPGRSAAEGRGMPGVFDEQGEPAGHECRDDDCSESNSVCTGDASMSCASI
eukprot:TRINITY_DN14363_c0_g1_i1.p1 TRINITY_DN14363_c0_g1~~TRINITY_DN14363_c0_g1_i1.p1  ORF type:complete len:606 (-),score=58.46 TRINITY_DN14363_c0_g1_i1:50-1867(-)